MTVDVAQPLAADDLSQIIRAYNEVTDRLQRSHELLQDEVHRLREELASKNAQLERSRRLSALGEMAAGIAHEVRNPLAAIQLYAGMVIDDLKRGDARPDIALENTRKIASAVRGLNAIVVDVLSFAREIEPEPAILTVIDLIERAIDAHRPAIDAANVTVRLPACADLTVHADATLLHQALLNLVRNAVDAMTAVNGTRELIFEAEAEDDALSIVVRDTGPGIDEKQIDRIFNPFFTTRNTGTGLGLAIVHRIVDAHGGAISVRNDHGAVFTLRMPAVPAPAGTVYEPQEAPA